MPGSIAGHVVTFPVGRTGRVPVVLGTDIGTDIDDTWALAMLLRCPELEPRLVVTATGDTSYRARLAAGILTAGGRDDVPIGVGIPTALPDGVLRTHPQQGFADEVDLAKHRGATGSPPRRGFD